jgi:hypothetical protein
MHPSFTFPFYVGGPLPTTDDEGCWTGTPSAFEQRLLEPFPTYALEQLRQRFLFTLTTTHAFVKSARVLLQMAFETEVASILTKQINLAAGVLWSRVCERRRYIDIDQDMHKQRYLIAPALDELAHIPGMPEPYVDFLIRYLASDYPRYRMSALSGVVCVAKVLQP